MNIKLYKQQISELGVEGFQLEPKSLMEATSLLTKLKEYQKVLKQIKFNIRIDARKIRKEYINNIEKVNESLKNNKKTDKKARMAIKLLKIEKDEKIAPYDVLDNLIDNYIIQIEDSKIFLREYIKNQMK
ncbi:MAG: hypothetical protein U1C19_04000 [Methanobacteriaceae archaeon]|nr:hypothetical protein [Methanobacteriaceae archaeon]